MAQTFKDKTPPHDNELEQAALGSMMSDNEAVTAAIQMHLHPDDFYSRANTRIFESILSLDAKGLRADIQTVVQELKQQGKLDEAGGASYVSSLTTVIPSSANIDYYAQMVKSYSLKRSLLRVASQIGVNAYDESLEANKLLEEVQRRIFELSDKRQIFSSKKVGELLKEATHKLDELRKSKNPITGIPSGFEKLDQMTYGFQNEEFIIIGARPSVGKTALALNIASHIAIHQNIPLAFFSLEMSERQLVDRLISGEAEVNGESLRSGFLSTGDYKKIIDVMGIMYEAPFYIVDMPHMDMLNLRAHARKLCSQKQIKIIFIDYLGLIVPENTSGKQKFEQVSDISRSLKSLARELRIPVVVLCQLNRDAQSDEPTLANLRDSGSIEQDADLVLFLHKPKKSKKDKDEEKTAVTDIIPTDLIIAKQRNGPTGKINLQFVKKYTKFETLSPSASKEPE